MKQLVCIEPGKLKYRDEAMPKTREGYAIVKVLRVGICGTDLHAFDGTQPYFSYPRVLGHELAGEIVEIAESHSLSIGDLVSVIPYFSCGTCIACRRGKANCCERISVFGVHQDGGMQEYISVPTTSLIKRDGLSLDQLALVEPLAIGWHGVRRTSITPGDQVLVIGAGPIGLGIGECAKQEGATVLMMDVNRDRLRCSEEQFQMPFVIDALNHPEEAIAEVTKGEKCPIVIDATGNLGAINSGLKYLAHGGEYVLVGLQREPFSFSHPEFHKRESTLMSSRNATRADFEAVMDLLLQNRIVASKFISHRLAFDELGEKFQGLSLPANQVIKAMIDI